MKSRQFCSVCKEWLEMEVVPTNDGEEDDGVIWFRCPQCQGFLPKLSGADSDPEPVTKTETAPEDTAVAIDPDTGETDAETLPWDSPADMMAARDRTGEGAILSDMADRGDDVTTGDPRTAPASGKPASADKSAEPAEPLHEYAAMLAKQDGSEPTPYRPWETYEVGQCIHHQAWEDCGIVVAKEDLPGGRQIIKCYFEEAGVVRLIEKAPR